MEAALRTPGFADIYERVLVPGIFGPWAEEVIARTRPIGPSDRILDLGCGTGIVARQLRERLGGGVRIAGADASSEMIAKARELAPQIDFREARAESLPFEDASFELVVCQQMLQFAPDPLAVLREVRRVLVPGGRFVAATWRARRELPLYDQLGLIAERHLGPSNDKRFALGDDAALRELLAAAGFGDVRVDIVERKDRLREFPIRGSVMAANHDLSRFSPAELESRLAAIEAESHEAARQFWNGEHFAAPSRANLITAVAREGQP